MTNIQYAQMTKRVPEVKPKLWAV